MSNYRSPASYSLSAKCRCRCSCSCSCGCTSAGKDPNGKFDGTSNHPGWNGTQGVPQGAPPGPGGGWSGTANAVQPSGFTAQTSYASPQSAANPTGYTQVATAQTPATSSSTMQRKTPLLDVGPQRQNQSIAK